MESKYCYLQSTVVGTQHKSLGNCATWGRLNNGCPSELSTVVPRKKQMRKQAAYDSHLINTQVPVSRLHKFYAPKIDSTLAPTKCAHFSSGKIATRIIP